MTPIIGLVLTAVCAAGSFWLACNAGNEVVMKIERISDKRPGILFKPVAYCLHMLLLFSPVLVTIGVASMFFK